MNKLLKTVQTIIKRTEPDGRMEYGLLILGHTLADGVGQAV